MYVGDRGVGLPALELALDVSAPVVPIDVFSDATGMLPGKYGYCYDDEPDYFVCN
jgi:hypothetical protein